MRRARRITPLPLIVALACVMALGAAIARGADHGAPAPAEGETPAERVWQPGKPLNGRFDLTVLRGVHRVSTYRFTLPEVQTILSRPEAVPVFLRIKFCVEFGSEAGMAEVQRHETTIASEVDAIVSRWEPRSLLRPAGKLALKDALTDHLNERLRTAAVRKVYITDFAMSAAR